MTIRENKIIVAVVGLGMGAVHLKGVMDRKVEIGAICDINEELLNKTGNEFDIPKERRFTNWKEILKLENVNAVIIATPDQMHREMSEEFLKSGKHVLCEKPLALDYEDLSAIIRASNKSDKVYMVGQVCRFTPAFVKAKELIDNGTIGEVFYMESEYAHDYAKILHNWRADPKRHGVVGGGCHAVDLLRWYGGDVSEVFAYGVHKMLPQAPYDDTTIAVMKWENGTIGKIFVSTGCKRDYTMRTLIYGSKGTIICDNTSDHMKLFTLENDGVTVNTTPKIIPIDINNHNVGKEFDVFADHILNGTEVKMSALEGAKTVATCMAIVKSSETGKPEKPDFKF